MCQPIPPSAAASSARDPASDAGRNCAWRDIATVPTNQRVYAYGWHTSADPIYDEEAMVWKDRADGQFYYAPQGGIPDWTPTHWMPLHGAPCSGREALREIVPLPAPQSKAEPG